MAATAPRSFVSLNRVDYRTKIDLITDFLIEYFNHVDNTTVFVAKRRKKKTGGTNNKIANIFLKNSVYVPVWSKSSLSVLRFRCVHFPASRHSKAWGTSTSASLLSAASVVFDFRLLLYLSRHSMGSHYAEPRKV